MSFTFLIFEDHKAVNVEHIVQLSALTDADRDPRTGSYNRPIPADAATRVDTRSGFFYTSTEFDEVIEQLIMATQTLAVQSGSAHE